ncbi:MAG: hypothetical protein HY293_17165 [Planctomycetes bacterium]|nr:hypothetical protein [Planctomycetota bacterium]
MAALLLLLALLFPQEELRRRVEEAVARFGSDDVQARDAAATELTALGKPAIPELRRHEKHPDREVRLRIQKVIEEIERGERLLAVRPAPRRATLDLKDLPLAEALEKSLGPFGIRGLLDPKRTYARGRVTLSLKDATAWQVLDALMTAAGIEIDEQPGPLSHNGIYAVPWTFAPAQRRSESFRSAEAGEARVYAAAHGSEDGAEVHFQAYVALPPGHMARRVFLEDARLKDDQGRDLGASMEGAVISDTAPRHVGGNVAWWNLWRRGKPLTAQDLGDAKSFDLEGTLVVAYPRNLERAEAEFPDITKPVQLTPSGVSLTLTLEPAEGDRFMAGLHWTIAKGEEVESIWVWVADSEGRILTDTPRIEGSARDAGSMGGHVHVQGKVARAVAVRVSGEDLVKTPFAVKGIPRPNR